MVELSPDAYESMTSITKDEYELRLLAGARDAALEFYPPGSTEATIDTVEMEGVSLDTSLVILFRIPARPECVFGRRTQLWPTGAPLNGATPEEDGAWCVTLGIAEPVDQGDLAFRECVRDCITWLP